MIAETDDEASAVALWPMTHSLLQHFDARPNDIDKNQKKMNIISAAAELLKGKIKYII